jgi:integrase
MKRGNITKRGEKSWQLKIELPAVNGKRHYRYATVKGSYQDAQKELTGLLGALDGGTLPEPSKMTVADYVQFWLDNAHGRSPKTLERYGELIENQIKPHLGGHLLQKLRGEHLSGWHSALLAAGLSPRTIHHAHRLLSQVLAYAVAQRTLPRNPASGISSPKVEDAELEILEPEQVSAVLAALSGHSLYPIVALALATGMRRGELLGLQWGDIDLDGDGLRVERSLEETKAGLRLKPPKSKRGRRNIKLPAPTVDMLRAHKVAQMQLRFELGMGRLEASTLVFSDVEGRLLNPHA